VSPATLIQSVRGCLSLEALSCADLPSVSIDSGDSPETFFLRLRAFNSGAGAEAALFP
jgi:hypothetical protein